ncbi:uncharacterized protein LOC122621021 [Drosophila teissieri]|uniref:uncharacterized protein LOC122621021 n=1 Tax=Drosophila teissieri TaxID=7243 RepID=UPI001CB9EAF6|nr:uncharacterized protein LOC122621021 [Drosophila teissieri]
MSSNERKLEADYEKLIEQNIKSQFEKNGTMAALRSEMHVKILMMMRGQLDMSKIQSLSGGASGGSNHSGDHSLVKLINQLVMEFLDWFGYRHTLETFRMETGERVANRREMEQSLLITPESKDFPLLAQLVMRDWKSTTHKGSSKKVVQLPDPVKTTPQPSRKLIKELTAMRTPKSETKQDKLVQYNRQLISNDPFTKAITLKHSITATPHRSLKTEKCKSYVDSSESDILESDYSEEESEDSDAYKDIPDRQIFIDDLPPEGKYAPNHGEEGPFAASKNQNDGEVQQDEIELYTDNIPSSSNKPKTQRKPLSESSDSEYKPSISGRHKVSRQVYWNSPRRLPLRSKNTSKSEDEPEPAVTKPFCPDTQVGKMDFDSDYSSDED